MAEGKEGFFQYTCPHCGNLFSAKPTGDLTIVTCPTCKNRTSVVSPDSKKEVEAPAPEGEAPAEEPAPEEPKPPEEEPEPQKQPVLLMDWDESQLDSAVAMALKSIEEPLKQYVDELREELPRLLARHHGNLAAVAQELSTSRSQVHRWLKRTGIDPNAYRK